MMTQDEKLRSWSAAVATFFMWEVIANGLMGLGLWLDGDKETPWQFIGVYEVVGALFFSVFARRAYREESDRLFFNRPGHDGGMD